MFKIKNSLDVFITPTGFDKRKSQLNLKFDQQELANLKDREKKLKKNKNTVVVCDNVKKSAYVKETTLHV